MINFDKYFKVGALALGVCLCGGMDAFATQPIVTKLKHNGGGLPGEEIGSVIINRQVYVEKNVSGVRNQCPFHAIDLVQERAYESEDTEVDASRFALILQISDAWNEKRLPSAILSQDFQSMQRDWRIKLYLDGVENKIIDRGELYNWMTKKSLLPEGADNEALLVAVKNTLKSEIKIRDYELSDWLDNSFSSLPLDTKVKAYLCCALYGAMSGKGLSPYENGGLLDAMAYVQGRALTIIASRQFDFDGTVTAGTIVHTPHQEANELPNMYMMFDGGHFTALEPMR